MNKYLRELYALQAKIKALPCSICRAKAPSEVLKIRSKGPASEWNMVAVCERHRIDWQEMGYFRFLNRYQALSYQLLRKGWEYDEERLWHPKLHEPPPPFTEF